MTGYSFNQCELDLVSHELKVAGRVIPLEPKVFDLLVALVSGKGKLLTRSELIDSVWGGRAVTNAAIDVAVNAARAAVGDNGKIQNVIKTVPRKGFRINCPVEKWDCDRSPEQPLSASGDPSSSSPKLAVFLFENIDKLEEKHHIARGMADDIATELSRFSDLCVLSTQSTFQHDPGSAPVSQFATTLGATHSISGSMQLTNDDLILNVRLTELSTNKSVWSEQFKYNNRQTFETQDQIVSCIIGILTNRLEDDRARQTRKHPTASLSAYDCLLRGLLIFKSSEVSMDDNREALSWFDKALDKDPDYARARAWRCCAASNFWSNPPVATEVADSFNSMLRAMELDATDHEVHHIMGALQLIKGNHDLCEYHLSRSIALNANDSRILIRTGFYRSFLGDNDNALKLAKLAFERNPLHPEWYWNDLGVVYFGCGQFDEALNCLTRGYQDIEQNIIYRLACLIHLGQSSDIPDLLEQLFASNPRCSLSWIRVAYPFRCYRNASVLENLIEILGRAGIPMSSE